MTLGYIMLQITDACISHSRCPFHVDHFPESHAHFGPKIWVRSGHGLKWVGTEVGIERRVVCIYIGNMGRYLRTAMNRCALLTSRARHSDRLLPVSAAAVFNRRTTVNLPRLATSTSMSMSPPLTRQRQIVRYTTVR